MKRIIERKIVREYRVYDEEENLVFSSESADEVMSKFNMPCKTRIYNFKNTGVFFKPYCKADYKIRVDFEKNIIENRIFRLPKTKCQDIIDFPGEEWRQVPGEHPCNWCSNYGRIKYIDDDGNQMLAAQYRSFNSNGRVYLDATMLNPDKPSKKGRVHRIVAKTFLDKDFDIYASKGTDSVINHKDNDPENNSLSNLEIVTRQQNIQAAIDMGIQVGAEKRRCFAEKDGVRKEYDSTTELVQDITGTKNNGYFNAPIRQGRYKLYGWNIGYID